MSLSDKITSAVQWYEGMLLEPHHFQQNDLRHQQLLAEVLKASTSYWWGVYDIEYDPVALVGGVLRVNQLKCMMPDGYYVTFESTADNRLEFDVKKNAPDVDDHPVSVHVLMRAHQWHDGNAVGDAARFCSLPGPLVMDENTGDRPLSFPRLAPRLSLFVGDDLPPQHVALKIAEIHLQEKSYALTDYIAPTLKVKKGHALSDMCFDLIGRLRRKMVFLMDQIDTDNNKLVVDDIKDAFKTFVYALPPLEVMAYGGHSHPYDLFIAMAQMAGFLSPLKPGLAPFVLDFYDHNRLRASFTQVMDFICAIVDTLEEGYVVAPFLQTGRLFSLQLPHDLSTQQLILGVRACAGMSEAQTQKWALEAIMATESYSKIVQDRRILGLKRKVFYKDETMKLSPAKGITLVCLMCDPAYMQAGEKLIIFNPSDSDTQRPSEIVLYVEKKDELKDKGAVIA